MEAAGKVFGGVYLQAIKEPRGFIKIIQWVLSIFAFATTTSLETTVKFHASCNITGTPVDTEQISMKIDYPFSLEEVGFTHILCNKTAGEVTQNLLQGSQGSAQFYVFVGVIVFLYCLAALVMYIFCNDFYRKHNICTIGDFIASCVIVCLWLISSSAWAQGVVDVKYYTDLKDCGFFKHIGDCEDSANTCVQDQNGNYASLNVSIIFGFLNMLVWAGNLWFLYKETPWHKVQSKPPMEPGQPGMTDPQRI